MNQKVRTYIGIAGGNFGVSICNIDFYFNAFRVCNKETGFFPGTNDSTGLQPKDISKFLARLNKDRTKEGTYTYSLWSVYDQVIPAMSFSRATSEFPTMDLAYIFNSTEYDHLGVRDLTTHV